MYISMYQKKMSEDIGENDVRYELIATATFGLEAVVRREIGKTDHKVLKTEDGKTLRVTSVPVREYLWLRTGGQGFT